MVKKTKKRNLIKFSKLSRAVLLHWSWLCKTCQSLEAALRGPGTLAGESLFLCFHHTLLLVNISFSRVISLCPEAKTFSCPDCRWMSGTFWFTPYSWNLEQDFLLAGGGMSPIWSLIFSWWINVCEEVCTMVGQWIRISEDVIVVFIFSLMKTSSFLYTCFLICL